MATKFQFNNLKIMSSSFALTCLFFLGFYSSPCFAIESKLEISQPIGEEIFVIVNESVMPSRAVKAQSEVQVRKVQKMMSLNRDHTYSVMNELKILSRD
jgi:hypothetical protein